jgi:S-adenosylmethionine hydrolase
MFKPNGIITLTTDFSDKGYYTGAVKGVILNHFPEAKIITITNNIPAHDIKSCRWILLQSVPCFPEGTVHLAVVDPEVGSERKPLCIESGGHVFIGPDNGIFSWVLERFGSYNARIIECREFFRKPLSSTFHGRDVFAPVSALIAKGYLTHENTGRNTKIVLDPFPGPENDKNTITGSVIFIDSFGNIITNIHQKDISGAEHIEIQAGKFKITAIAGNYQSSGDLVAHIDSSGFIELAKPCGSAAELFKEENIGNIKVVLKKS